MSYQLVSRVHVSAYYLQVTVDYILTTVYTERQKSTQEEKHLRRWYYSLFAVSGVRIPLAIHLIAVQYIGNREHKHRELACAFFKDVGQVIHTYTQTVIINGLSLVLNVELTHSIVITDVIIRAT